jgi:hypothetical protein
MKIVDLIKAWHNDIVASVSKRLRAKEVVKVLSLAHSKELSETPFPQWQSVIQRQKQQIDAVMAGKLDIVDRRSWSYPWLPESVHRLNMPLMKPTPFNTRRFSETPIPRRAINLIKNSIIMSLRWDVQPTAEVDDLDPDREKRIRIAIETLKHPNRKDSFRSFWEQVTEDILLGGYGCFEPRITPDYKRPILMWPVDGASIQIYADWTEAVEDIKPHYAQRTGFKGDRGVIAFYDNELVYIRDNKRTSTPFGLGKMEIAFNVISYFLGSQEAAGKAGADQIHKTMLWWEGGQQAANLQTIRRYVTNELEGQSKVSIVAGMPKPQIVEINPVTPEDILLDWQTFQIKIIGQAFDLSPIAFGMDQHTNRATSQTMTDQDFRSAVYPMAIRIQEAITDEVLHRRLGWRDIEFVWVNIEDPDPVTLSTIQQKKYAMNAITPDEIREKDGKPPLPGGWGKLVQGQWQIVIAEAMAQAKGGAAGGGGGMGMPPGMGGGMPKGLGMGTGSGGNIGAGFSSDDITEMTPEDIQYLQEQGLLPETDDLADQMEQEQPGLLETLTDDLQEFFQTVDRIKDDEAVRTQPSKVTSKDQKEQLQKYKKSKHVPTYQERSLKSIYDATNFDKNNNSLKRFPLGKSQR